MEGSSLERVGVIVMLVAVSRVYLGLHWWTDVVAGVALGGAWLCLLVVGRLVFSRQGTVPEPVPKVAGPLFDSA